MTTTHAPLRRTFPFGVFTLTAAMTILSCVVFYLTYRSSHEGLMGLPSSERSALYRRTLEILNTTCANPRNSELLNYCREQASFIARFPECADDCQAIGRRLWPRPTK